MKKNLMLAGLAFVCGSLFAAAPEVQNVAMRQPDGSRRIEVTYDLKGADAVVTLDIQTNASGSVWASIGGEAIGEPSGDVCGKVTKGDGKRIVWNAKIWPNRRITDKGIRAVVTAWPTNAPATYATVDLTSGAIRFYDSTATLPGGFTNRAYKTQKLLLTRIPAKGKVWRMGSSPREKGSYGVAYECPHLVMLTDDFYFSVFELTDWQYKKLGGVCDGSSRSVAEGSDPDLCPPGPLYCGRIPAILPSKIRTLTGNAAFCLPTETQWEYACRGGMTTELYTGRELSAAGSEAKTADAGLEPIAWYDVNATGRVHTVGLKLPNAFGLYDMLGNAPEMCSDYYSDGDAYRLAIADCAKGGVAIDPPGCPTNCPNAYKDTGRIVRGGSASNFFKTLRASSRTCGPLWSGGAYSLLTGRVSCPASKIVK